MKTKDVIAEYGSVRKVAEALGISVQAIYAWGEDVPALRAYQLRESSSRVGNDQRDPTKDIPHVMPAKRATNGHKEAA